MFARLSRWVGIRLLQKQHEICLLLSLVILTTYASDDMQQIDVLVYKIFWLSGLVYWYATFYLKFSFDRNESTYLLNSLIFSRYFQCDGVTIFQELCPNVIEELLVLIRHKKEKLQQLAKFWFAVQH
jgi:hypothetical protein